MNAGAGAVDAGFGCAAATAALRCEFPIITSYRVLSSDHTLREFLASVLLPGHPRQNKDGPCRYMTGGSGKLLQDPSKGFCSFLDQLLQNLSWYSLFQVWAQLILLSDLTVSVLENPVPDLCLSDQACPEFTEKKLRYYLRTACRFGVHSKESGDTS